MRSLSRFVLAVVGCGFAAASAMAQGPGCPDRPIPGSIVADPAVVRSENGTLRVKITMKNQILTDGTTRYCYTYLDTEAPTLRLNPGEKLQMEFSNRIRGGQSMAMDHMQHDALSADSSGDSSDDPCNGTMTTASSNVHFHGLNVPAVCHQDEVVHTLINPRDPAFRYNIKIPANEPPGLYWYHPHPHGITQLQVMGGASGAIIIEGIEKIKPEVAGLTERVFLVRDQLIPGGGDADAGNLSINFVPSTYPATKAPIIQMKPLEKQFWRVVNASGQKFQALQVLIDGVPESLEVVAMDGVPLKTNLHTQSLLLPPAGRAEFIVIGPPDGVPSDLITLNVNTGPDGDPNPQHQLASIVATTDASSNHSTMPAKVGSLGPRRFDGLADQVPRVQRKLYFSEDLSDPDNPRFFITVDGATPKQFDPDEPPAIITQQGTTEDWTIENRSGELHAFHMHQIHFLVMAVNGVPVQDQNIQDTVKVLAWDGVSPNFPNVRIRMDFRYPESVGTYVYHCHILDHEDGGMMAKIEVDPAN